MNERDHKPGCPAAQAWDDEHALAACRCYDRARPLPTEIDALRKALGVMCQAYDKLSASPGLHIALNEHPEVIAARSVARDAEKKTSS